MIELRDVTFRYGHEDGAAGGETGVHNISLSVQSGQCAVLCGHSGCGKSTILRLVSGLAPGFYPGSLTGDVLVRGKHPSLLLPEERTKWIGVVFQDPRSQFFMENVRDELVFSAENLGISPDEMMARIAEQAERLGITHLLERKLSMLSSGQKQRVAIAAASVLSPPLLILDEPVANLDEQATQAVVEMLCKLKQNGTTLIISEHRLHPLLPVADSFVCMQQGELVRLWTKDEFSALGYEDVRAYGLRHPDMIKTCAVHNSEGSQAPETEHTLQVRNIAYRYKRNGDVLEGIDITIPKGRVTALTGENGAGKTTMGKILSGLLRQRKGTVSSRGTSLSAGQRRALSYLVMQDADYQLYADSVGNELVLGRCLDESLRSRAYEALDAFGLRELRDRHPASLSGGEKQRVTMAAAYCSDAELIVLDEPTSGMDGDGVQSVAAWARKLARSGKTVVIITHDRILTELACDYEVELQTGREGGCEVSTETGDRQAVGVSG